MARIRSIHPGQWTDEAFVSCSPLARLLAIGLRNEADDGGVFQWRPVQLKIRLLPADNCDPEALLAELVDAELVKRFDIGGKAFGAIRNFKRYQKPKSPSFLYPRSEMMEAYVTGVSETDTTPNGADTEDVREDFGNASEIGPQMGEERKGRERKKESLVQTAAEPLDRDDPITGRRSDGSNPRALGTSPRQLDVSPRQLEHQRQQVRGQEPEEFVRFYERYPRHEARADACKAWRQVTTGPDKAEPDAIEAGLSRALRHWQANGTTGKYLPLPASWLRGKRWTDDLSAPPSPNGRADDHGRIIPTHSRNPDIAKAAREGRDLYEEAMRQSPHWRGHEEFGRG